MRRNLRRALIVGAAAVIVRLVVFSVGSAYIYTHTGKGAVTLELGVPYQSVTVTTSDLLELAAS